MNTYFCSSIVEEIALGNKQFYINKRWLGGTLTNWKTISKSINRLDDLESLLNENSTNQSLSKKELLDFGSNTENPYPSDWKSMGDDGIFVLKMQVKV